MNGFVKRTSVIIMMLVILATSCFGVAFAVPEEFSYEAAVLFTHDLHSHLLPSKDEGGGEFGGYARLMTTIKEAKKKYPNSILVDGGDFSMGSLFQTCFKDEAIELRMMGEMGYDATTFGNHEFDYLPEGLASMLSVAASADEAVPPILNGNYFPPEDSSEAVAELMWQAFEDYGVREYMIIKRGGLYFALFGIFGYDSDACAPNSGMVLEDPVKASRRIVDKAVAECKELYGTEPIVVCLSHSGTEDGKGEDYELAKNVDGIDLIVSGHTHTDLPEAIEVNGTYIVSAGEYGRYLGVANLHFDGSEATLVDYELIPVDISVDEDEQTAARIEEFKGIVEENYLSDYGVGFDEILLMNPYRFDSVDEVYATQHESTLGNVFADAYKAAVEKATGETVDVALTASGVIRETLPTGSVTVSDVFNAASLGVGTEGELVKLYLTGKDLKAALEVDASVQPIMRSAQLFMSGVEYSFNTYRMIFNKVDTCNLRRADGTLEEIDDDKLYSVVTGMYVGQMLGAVKEKSFGLLSITPRDKEGNPIAVEDFVNFVVKSEEDVPVKEWYAITSYLKEMGGEMSGDYAQPDGRKVVYSSLSPADMLRNANIFTYVALGVIIILLLVIVLIVRGVVRKARKKKSKEV